MFFTGAFLKELPFRQHPSLVFTGNNSFQENSCSEILSLKFFLISPTENPPKNGAITLFSEPPVRGIIGIGQTQKFPHKTTQEKQRFPCRSPNRSTVQLTLADLILWRHRKWAFISSQSKNLQKELGLKSHPGKLECPKKPQIYHTKVWPLIWYIWGNIPYQDRQYKQ